MVVLVQGTGTGTDTGTRYELETLHQCGKKVKTKNQKVLGASSYVWRSCRENTGRGGGGFCPPLPLPLSWIGLSNIEITKYFNYGPRFTGDFSRDNLARIKFEAYVINLDDKQSKETHWISLFIDENAAIYFDSFGIEYIPKEL